MKKSILLVGASLALAATMVVGGTLAHFTDTEVATNVMVSGNVDIIQHEQDRYGNDFVQGQMLTPIVAVGKDEKGYNAAEEYIDKLVSVENVGKNDAYVRTFVAVPVYEWSGFDRNNASTNVIHWNGSGAGHTSLAGNHIPGTYEEVDNDWYWGKAISLDDGSQGYWPGNFGDWNSFGATIDGQEYLVYVITHGRAIEPGEVTAPSMQGLYLDSRVDYNNETGKYTIKNADGQYEEIENFDGSVEVLVATQAVQYSAGWADAFAALNTAFYTPDGNNHPWVEGVEIPEIVNIASADGLKDAIADSTGDVIIDAEGATLDGMYGTTFPADKTVTIANAKFEGEYGLRYSYSKGTVVFTNCVFEATGAYAAHFDGGDGDVIFNDCTFIGWNSFGRALNSISFNNCDFYGNGTYGLVRTYTDCTMTGCTFDLSNVNSTDNWPDRLETVLAENTMTITDCTVIGDTWENICHAYEGKIIVDGTVVSENEDLNA